MIDPIISHDRIDKSEDLYSRNQFKRFFKKEIFLQTSLNFYLNWREVKDSSFNSETSFSSNKMNFHYRNSTQTPTVNSINPLKQKSLINLQNTKSFQNFATKQKSQSSSFQRSHSYWLFPLFALIGSADTERVQPYLENLSQFSLFDKTSKQNVKLTKGSNIFDSEKIEIPMKILNTKVFPELNFFENADSRRLSHLHVDLKRKLFNQFLDNSVWNLQWWKLTNNFQPIKSEITNLEIFTTDLTSNKSDKNFSAISLLSRKRLNSIESFKNEETSKLPRKISPFKNIFNKNNDKLKSFINFKTQTNQINSDNNEDLNANNMNKLQPVQSYLQSSLLYDSLFFDPNSNPTEKVGQLYEKNNGIINSEVALSYLKEIKPAEVWKNYFEAYTQKILKNEFIMSQERNEELSFNSLNLAKEKSSSLVSNSHLLQKILFQSPSFLLTKNVQNLQSNLEYSLKTKFLTNLDQIKFSKKENQDSELIKEMLGFVNTLRTNINSKFDLETNLNQNLISTSLFTNFQLVNPAFQSNLDRILVTESLKLKTPIFESNKKTFHLVPEKAKQNAISTKFKPNELSKQNSLINLDFDSRNIFNSKLRPYFPVNKILLNDDLSKNKEYIISPERNELVNFEENLLNFKNQKLGANLVLNLKSKMENLTWLRSKLMNLLKSNWIKTNSNSLFNGNEKLPNSTKKMRKIEKILRSYLSIKKVSTESAWNAKKADFQNTLPKLSRNSNKLWNSSLINEKMDKKQKFHLYSHHLQKLKLKLTENLTSQNMDNLKSPGIEVHKVQETLSLIRDQKKILTPKNLMVKKGLVFISKLEKDKLSNLNRIEKIKNQQKQRRRKKQRRENRRRKKRKRFYPRPLWLRFSLYRKFLAKRYIKPLHFDKDLFNESLMPKLKESKSSHSYKNFGVKNKQDAQNFRLKIYRTNRQFSEPAKEKSTLKTQKLFSMLPIFAENRFFYIPKFVIADFQRSLLKSYWLKANLKPYLTRIQNSLDQINENEKDVNFLMSFKTLFASFFRMEPTSFQAQVKVDNNNISGLNIENNIYPNFGRRKNEFIISRESNDPRMEISDSNQLILMNSSLNAKLIHLSEYNQILYKRILNFIKNIKMNLNTNGNVRPHPFHEGRTKQEKIEIDNIWNRINQVLNFEYFSSSLESSGLFTNLRMLWSINKTNVFAFKDQNDLQKIWNFAKYRDQKKSNKTRLLLSKLRRFLSFERKKDQSIEFAKFNNVLKKSKVLFTKSNKDLPAREKTEIIQKFKKLKSYRLKTPKRSLYFWWNVNELNIPNFNIHSPSKIQSNVQMEWSPKIFNFKMSQTHFEKDILMKSCFLILHICSLFALLQISQVRSVLKFAFLISSKFLTAYFMIFSLAINRFVNLKTESKFLKSFVNQSAPPLKTSAKEITNEQNSNGHFNSTNFNDINELDWNKISYKKQEKSQTFTAGNSYELLKATEGFDPSKMLSKLSGNSSKSQSVVLNADPTSLNVLLSQSQLFVIRVTKLSILSSYQLKKFVYSIFSKFIELIEGFLAFIYQFLEKPAEFMLDWIAQLFLIEWSSSLRMVLPDLLENNIWTTFFKLSRNASIFGLAGILIQRRFLSLTETFASLVTEADTDLIIRQKKGQIFWEIWSEILMKAVDKYNMNLSSLTTLKDEQDRLLQNLINDSNWNWSSSSLQTLIPFLEIQHRNKIQTWELPSHQQFFSTPEVKNSSIASKQVDSFMSRIFPNSIRLREIMNSNIETKTSQLLQSTKFVEKQQNSWATYQSITLQARESDLFIEFNPPHTFQNTRIFKHAGSLQPNIGGIVCEIYAGIFSRKVSKNTLVIGPSGREKTWLIQALAGETEVKLMVDNAARYAIVQRGVAVGMKLLRDVFEGLALNAPCIFLIEDIHVIGEKRSLLISEDQINSADNFLGTEREEIHEKNQMISQVTRHMIAHYKKPYKGDFSMTIAANRFNFQLFLGVSPPLTRHTNLTVENPLSYKDLPGFENDSQSGRNKMFSSTTEWKSESQSQTFSSFLQIPKQQKFSPSPISPLSLLMLREQKKLKPKKRVKELPWFGVPADQANSVPKSTYSIRVKVAMLADLAISNLSVKLDMITELLVIIDSVRSNRGFMIFATTHLPYKLDPALRRPGRLDETLNLGLIPNFKDRLEILKLSIGDLNPLTPSNFDSVRATQFFESNLVPDFVSGNLSLANRISRTFNAFDYSLELKSLTQVEIQTLVNKTKRLLQNSKIPYTSSNENNQGIVQNIQTFSLDSQIEKFLTFEITKLFNSKKKFQINEVSFSNQQNEPKENLLNEAFAYLNSGLLNLNAKIYSKTSQIIFEMQYAKNAESYTLKCWNTNSDQNENFASLFEILYSTENQANSLKSQNLLFERISILLAKKVGEYLIFSNSKVSNTVHSSQKLNVFNKNGALKNEISKLCRIKPTYPLTLATVEDRQTGQLSPYGYIVSLLQKRANFSQNMAIGEFLSFQDKTPFKESPGPTLTSILNPLQKYENYKRAENDFQNKPFLSIQEKINLHQHQRYLKNLYQKPIQHNFQSISLNSQTNLKIDSKEFKIGLDSKTSGFHNSIRELGYHDLILSKPTSVNTYYRNRILGRHRYYYLNQWWTGQLPEHNAEMTFSSDVDWRSKFIKTNTVNSSNLLNQKANSKKLTSQNQSFSAEDIQIDFPDPDQYYNPRSRRWILNSGSWVTWNNVSNLMMLNFSSYYLLQNFQKTYNYLSDQREMLDYYSYLFLKYGKLKEIDFIWLNKNS